MNAKFHPLIFALSLVARGALAGQADSTDPSAESPAPVTAARPAHFAKAGADDDGGSARSVVKGPVISLYHGEVQVLDLANVVRIAVGNGEVLRANVVASNQVVLIGEAAGNTSLHIWTHTGTQFTYEVTVRSFDVSQILRDVRDLLAEEPGISARQVDGHVLIEGESTASKSAGRIEALKKIYPQIVSTVPVRRDVPAPQMDRMVYMDVRVVEILKSSLRQLGVNWDHATTGGLSAGASGMGVHNVAKNPVSGYFGIAANLSSKIDLLEKTGESWTLAEPTVSCKSGGEAKFTVGGEIPVPVAGALGTQTVIYKEYGVILEFKPIADGQGNVSSTIVAEVSQPDSTFANSNGTGLVAFLKTRTQTDVSLRENETLVISGLLKNAGNKSAQGIPGAKDIPVLGHLFKSQQYQNDRTELVVMVTPHSVEVGGSYNAGSISRADQMQAHVQPAIDVINNRLAE
jgi:pilus assembly protein CpaC